MVSTSRVPRFRLRFPERQVDNCAARYQYEGEQELLDGPVARARVRGYLEKPEFLEIAKWKTPRSRSRCARNDAPYVEEVTRWALANARSPRLAIEGMRGWMGCEKVNEWGQFEISDSSPRFRTDVRIVADWLRDGEGHSTGLPGRFLLAFSPRQIAALS